MKVLLVKPPEPHKSVEVIVTRITEHLGLGYIAAVLRKNLIDVEILDSRIKDLDMEGQRDVIMMSQFDLLGISMPYQWSVPEVVDLIKGLRQMGLKKPIMVGGHSPSFYYNELLQEENLIDFVCIGEGEYTVLGLVEAIQGNRSLESIKGLAYRKEGNVVFNGYRELIENLDELPFLARDVLPEILEIEPGSPISISGSRGCSYSGCSFCDIQSFYRMCPGKLWRTRSAKNIVDEIQYLKNTYKSDYFGFIDDDFFGYKSGRRQRIQELCDELKKRKLDVKFSIMCNVRDIEEDMFMQLKEVGLSSIFMGVESGVQRTLNTFNKGVTVEQNKDAIMRVKQMGIGYECGSIFIDPYTTLDEVKENIAFWESVGLMSVDQFKELSVFQGTPLQKKLLEEGRIISENYNYTYNHIINKDVMQLENIMDVIRKNYITPYLSRIRKIRMKTRRIMTVHNISSDEIEKLWVECGEFFYNWFYDVFNMCLKQILDDIHNINDENIELKLLMIFSPHIKIYEEKYKSIQDRFEKVISNINIQ